MKKELTKKQWQTPMIILFDQNQVLSGKICLNSEVSVFSGGGPRTYCVDTVSGGRTTHVFGGGLKTAGTRAACPINEVAGSCPVAMVS